MTIEEKIKEKCHFDNMRFGKAFSSLSRKYEHNNFTSNLLSNVGDLIDLVDKGGYEDAIYPSEAYLTLFMRQNPSIQLGGRNPFYIIRFSQHLPIHLIFFIIDECKKASILKYLIRDAPSESAIVCLFDLYDDESDKSLATGRD